MTLKLSRFRHFLGWVRLGAMLLIGGAALALGADDDAVTAAMRDALYAEEVKGDPAAALKAYEAVTARFEEQRDLAATALFRQAECLRKLNRPQDAAAVYRKVLLLFPDKDRLARLSRENLTALGEKAPDTMPAAASGDPTLTEDEQKELARVKAMAANSPDLVFQRTDNSYGAFFAAARNGHAAVIEWLLATHPNEAKPHLNTALRDAVTAGQLKACEKLIAAGAELDGTLSLALQNQRWSVLRLLLASKADPNEYGEVSMQNGGTDGSLSGSLVVQALGSPRSMPTDIFADILKAGGDPNKPGKFVPRNGGAAPSVTPLELAVRFASIDIVRLLLQAKADVNRASDRGKETPLMLALRERSQPDRDAIVEALSAAGADWSIASEAGSTTLHEAAARGDEKWVETALKAGIDPNTASKAGSTPLMSAQFGEFGYRVVQRLLDAGAKADAVPPAGQNPFAWACRRWPENEAALATLAALVKAGASVAEKDQSIGPPLQAAFYEDGVTVRARSAVADLLLAHGAKPKDTELLTKPIPEWARSRRVDNDTWRKMFLPLWQAANWRDNPQLPNAIWFDDGEAFPQVHRLTAAAVGALSPMFIPVFSKESALDGVPTLRQVVREMLETSGVAAHDWTKATLKRRNEDGSVAVLPRFDIVAIAAGKAEAPVLQWGDAISLEAGEGSRHASFDPVRAWAVAEPAMTVRIDLGEAGLVTNRTATDASPLWDVKSGGDFRNLNSLIRQAGIPRDLLQLEPVVRRPGPDGILKDTSPTQTGNQNVDLRHGDIVVFAAPKPKENLTADELRAGVWLCEAESGPFFPVNPTLGINDQPSLGYLLLALQAPHPGPFQSVDWPIALLRVTENGGTHTESLAAALPEQIVRPGVMLILPKGAGPTAVWPGEIEAPLRKLSFDYKVKRSDQGIAQPRTYRPRFFTRRMAGDRVVWADAAPDAAGPLLPLRKDLLFSDAAVDPGVNVTWDSSSQWMGEGMELTWGYASQTPTNVAPSAQPQQRKRVVLPSQ